MRTSSNLITLSFKLWKMAQRGADFQPAIVYLCQPKQLQSLKVFLTYCNHNKMRWLCPLPLILESKWQIVKRFEVFPKVRLEISCLRGQKHVLWGHCDLWSTKLHQLITWVKVNVCAKFENIPEEKCVLWGQSDLNLNLWPQKHN